MSPADRLSLVMLLIVGATSWVGVAGSPDPDSSELVSPEPDLVSGETVLAREPPELVARLLEQKAIVLADLGEGRDEYFHAYVIFDQPRAHAMRLLTQTSRQIEFRPDVKAIEGVHWDGPGSLDEHHLRVLFIDIVFRLRYEMDWERRHIRWRLDEEFDNDVKRIEGFWELYPLEEGRTLARFGSVVDVGSVLPSFVQGWITRKNLPRSIEHCRRWVDSGGSYRP